jgi:hypothetical protein
VVCANAGAATNKRGRRTREARLERFIVSDPFDARSERDGGATFVAFGDDSMTAP